MIHACIPARRALTAFAASALLALAAVTAQAQAPATPTLANPASQNCAAKGGTLTIERNGKGGEFGVCTFTDNLQCEEWAMMRGDCRTGGIKVTGYATPAGRYCAITGGTYRITGSSNTPDERGTCAFKGGGSCPATAYFDGTCTRDSAKAKTGAASTPAVPKPIRAVFVCAAGKRIDATFINGANSKVLLTLSDGRKLTLPQTMSGSGARYANADESIVFWNKGNTAFIEEKGATTYADCATGK